ncbi:8891_t:CDS:2 [Entrophospora sp. SA101]|nr:8891_t:CDS:2 [Entrophospora sp. SA101]
MAKSKFYTVQKEAEVRLYKEGKRAGKDVYKDLIQDAQEIKLLTVYIAIITIIFINNKSGST